MENKNKSKMMVFIKQFINGGITMHVMLESITNGMVKDYFSNPEKPNPPELSKYLRKFVRKK